MEKLDQNYLTDLVTKVMTGSSNAFAELFAVIHPRIYAYILFMLHDEKKADEMMKKVCIHILHNAERIQNPEVFMPWCFRLAYHYCIEQDFSLQKERSTANASESVRRTRILSLPLVEAQILLMNDIQGISLGEISDLLNYSRRFVKRCIKAGKRHMQSAGGDPAENKQDSMKSGSKKERFEAAPFDQDKKIRMLAEIYDSCEREPNTVPMEALSDYAVYRKERFNLQRIVLGAAMALFALLPVLFVLPDFEVVLNPAENRGLPVYTIDVHSLLPVERVAASQSTHYLPVYEASARRFTVEPTRNGKLHIEVELFNRQHLEKTVDVTEVDAHGPQLLDSKIEEDEVTLIVNDTGIGVNYHSIYAIDKKGSTYLPIAFDNEAGTVTFSFPDDNWDVYIPDHLGNVLHLAFTIS